MDGQQFDALARRVATRGTRRSLVGGIAAGLLAMVPGVRTLAAPPEQGNKPDGKKCNKNHQCVSGYCDATTGTCGPCATNADCDDGDPCTYDVCGTSSRKCFHDPIPDCRPCTGSGGCPTGGECCGGRCCPVGSVCGTSPSGEPTCCTVCANGMTCCDQLDEQAYLVNVCYDPCGFCCAGTARCDVLPDGSIYAEQCVLPGNSR